MSISIYDTDFWFFCFEYCPFPSVMSECPSPKTPLFDFLHWMKLLCSWVRREACFQHCEAGGGFWDGAMRGTSLSLKLPFSKSYFWHPSLLLSHFQSHLTSSISWDFLRFLWVNWFSSHFDLLQASQSALGNFLSQAPILPSAFLVSKYCSYCLLLWLLLVFRLFIYLFLILWNFESRCKCRLLTGRWFPVCVCLQNTTA